MPNPKDALQPGERPARRSETAQRLLAAIETQPGQCITDLRRVLGVSHGAVRHHLATLLRAGLATTRAHGRRCCVYPAHAVAQDGRTILGAALTGRTRRVVAEAIAHHGTTTIKDVVKTTGLSPRSVYHHVSKLIAAALVERQGYRTIAATPRLTAAFRENAA